MSRVRRGIDAEAALGARVGGGEASDRSVALVLAERVGAYRRQLSIDLMVIDRLLHSGRADAALSALEEQREALRVFVGDVEAVLGQAGRPAPGTRRRVRAPLEPAATAGIARRVMAVALAASALVWLVALGPMQSTPRPQLTGAQEQVTHEELAAARQRLEQLQRAPGDVALVEQARDLHDRLLSLPEAALVRADVRAEVEGILQREHETLLDRRRLPQVRVLLDEVRALRASLLPPASEVAGGSPVQLPVTQEPVAPRGDHPRQVPPAPPPRQRP
ncbi:MAG: hypothetical protein M3276_06210, partial [Actinomycetota bacterium]|nr:hypothetical protein [Actinomycetota bacterium]